MAESGNVTVRQNLDEQRYEALVDGRLAGWVTYVEQPGRIAFVHTEIQPEFEGHGVGGRLAAAALDDAKARGLAVMAQCPFVAEYIRRHPQYQDLLADADDPR